MTVSEPRTTGCSTPSTITTKELKGVLGMNKAGTIATFKVTPKEGDHLRDDRTHRNLRQRGSLQSHRHRLRAGDQRDGVFAKTQKLTFSEAIQKSAGTSEPR